MRAFSNPQTSVNLTPKLPSLASLGQALPSPLDSKLTTHSPKVEPDSFSKKRDYKSSPKSCKCPISVAAGSRTDLEKSQHECETARANNLTERSMPSTGKGRAVGSVKTAWPFQKQKFAPCVHTARYEHGQTFKCGRSIDLGASTEHPHSKEWWLEWGRSHKCRCTHTLECVCLPPPPFFYSTPVVLHHTSTDSLGVQSFEYEQGVSSSRLRECGHRDVCIPHWDGYSLQCKSTGFQQRATHNHAIGCSPHDIQAD